MTSPADANLPKDESTAADGAARGGKRRWLRFSLKTMLLVMTLGVVLMGAWRLCLTPLRMQAVAAQDFQQAGGTIHVEVDEGAWPYRLVGAELPEKIIYADLRNCKLTERTRSHLTWLYGVQTLYLSGPEVTNILLHAVSRLPSLRKLGLDSTLVTHDALEEFSQSAPHVQVILGDAPEIRELDSLPGVSIELNLRKRSDTQLEAIVGLTLYGDDVDNATLAKVDLPLLLSLRRLSIHSSSVDDDGLSVLSNLDKLTHLDLCASDVTDGCISHINHLRSLTRLKLKATQITSVGVADLSNPSKLTTLDISWTSVDDLSPLAKMTSLKSLNLSNCPFDVDQLAHISQLVELESLELDDVPVTDDALSHLGGLHSLRELSLVGASLTDEGLKHLHSMKNLRVLFLTGNVTDEAVAKLRGAIPGLETVVRGELPRPTRSDTESVPPQR
jgi:Leucine-rich repeat (LRR) protein